MPWPKSSVPKFGNWEKSEDLSYSIIFDKARSEKEMFLHSSGSDFLSDQNFYKNNNAGAGTNTFFPDKARADRERILATAQQDKTLTDTHRNVLQNPEVTPRRGESLVFHDESSGLRARIPEYSRPKFPLGAGILQEQKNSSNILPDPWNQFEAPANNSSFPSGAPSSQPLQIESTKRRTSFNERPHVDQADIGFQERLHARSTNTPGRYRFEENPPIGKIRSAQRSFEISRATDMQRKYAVPKFGDWDSEHKFTEVFNKAQIEKSSKYACNPSTKAVSPLRPDEDLYKSSEASAGSTERKKQRGWFRIICCTEPFPS